jgi:hypothetical protein
MAASATVALKVRILYLRQLQIQMLPPTGCVLSSKFACPASAGSWELYVVPDQQLACVQLEQCQLWSPLVYC